MGERRDATCSAARKISKGRGDGLLGGYKRPKPSWSCESRWRGSLGWRERSSESRMRENRLSGLMRGGKQTVPSRPLPAHSTEALWECMPAARNSVSITAPHGDRWPKRAAPDRFLRPRSASRMNQPPFHPACKSRASSPRPAPAELRPGGSAHLCTGASTPVPPPFRSWPPRTRFVAKTAWLAGEVRSLVGALPKAQKAISQGSPPA
jgi:hypothetical protein